MIFIFDVKSQFIGEMTDFDSEKKFKKYLILKGRNDGLEMYLNSSLNLGFKSLSMTLVRTKRALPK